MRRTAVRSLPAWWGVAVGVAFAHAEGDPATGARLAVRAADGTMPADRALRLAA